MIKGRIKRKCQAVEAPVGAKAARSGRMWSPGLATTWPVYCNYEAPWFLPGGGGPGKIGSARPRKNSSVQPRKNSSVQPARAPQLRRVFELFGHCHQGPRPLG